MYGFNIIKDEGAWRFELDGINLFVDDFYVQDEKHFIKTPQKAYAFFNISGHLYGVSNTPVACTTAEDFYDRMTKQYSIFRKKEFTGLNGNNTNQEIH